MIDTQKIEKCLHEIYGAELALTLSAQLRDLMNDYETRVPKAQTTGLSERDALLITYPDQLLEPGRPPLASLGEFCADYLSGIISGIHLLPFYPWSSDDGFSVIDYREVSAQYGTWDDVERLGTRFRLMLDAVINHASAASAWFRGFLRDDPPYRDFFIRIDGSPDLSSVARPRATPLLTRFGSVRGERSVWTTFSADQVDLNYRNPAVLLQVVDVLLFYVSHGAALIRLDAVGYLWKEMGTNCIHLRQTHAVVQLIRAILDQVAPHVMLITETNVPQAENVSYFGDGTNEAGLVYNFALPPLVLHALQTGEAGTLARWAGSIRLPSDKVTFLNFLASHDGIGLDPVRGILSEKDIEHMANDILAGGGLVSNKSKADGTLTPYELNVNYLDALDATGRRQPPNLRIERFVTVHAILFSFLGLPAVYFHSLFGSRGWLDGVASTGRNRTINRQRLDREALETDLADSSSMRARIFRRLSHLLTVRAGQPAFGPHAGQRVPNSQGSVLAILRGDPGMERRILCLYNLSAEVNAFRLDQCDAPVEPSAEMKDLITGKLGITTKSRSLILKPYQSVWLSV